MWVRDTHRSVAEYPPVLGVKVLPVLEAVHPLTQSGVRSPLRLQSLHDTAGCSAKCWAESRFYYSALEQMRTDFPRLFASIWLSLFRETEYLAKWIFQSTW